VPRAEDSDPGLGLQDTPDRPRGTRRPISASPSRGRGRVLLGPGGDQVHAPGPARHGRSAPAPPSRPGPSPNLAEVPRPSQRQAPQGLRGAEPPRPPAPTPRGAG
jgi:hypothetical protein